MTRPGPAIAPDLADLIGSLERLVAGAGQRPREDGASSLRARLVADGWWTAGSDPIDDVLAALVAAEVARASAEDAWSLVRAGVAAVAARAVTGPADLVEQIEAGRLEPIVVDLPDADLADGTVLSGQAGGVRAASSGGSRARVLVVLGRDRAVVSRLDRVRERAEPRTGLAGPDAVGVAWGGTVGADLRVTSRPVAALRQRLHLGAVAVASGVARAAADQARAYAAERHQFGAPLTALPTVRAGIQERRARLDGMFARWCGRTDLVAEELADAVRPVLDDAIDVASSSLLAHGGYGYLREYGIERRVRDLVSLRAAVDAEGLADRAGSALAPTAARVGAAG